MRAGVMMFELFTLASRCVVLSPLFGSTWLRIGGRWLGVTLVRGWCRGASQTMGGRDDENTPNYSALMDPVVKHVHVRTGAA